MNAPNEEALAAAREVAEALLKEYSFDMEIPDAIPSLYPPDYQAVTSDEVAAFIAPFLTQHARKLAVQMVRETGAVEALRDYAGGVGVWWTMVEADRECSEDTPLEPAAVVLHFMGSGASAQVSVQDLRDLNGKAQTALAALRALEEDKA